MIKTATSSLNPAKIRHWLAAAFCLMSLIPILAGIYICSLFIHFPFQMEQEKLVMAGIVLLMSLSLSLLGYYSIRQWVMPIEKVVSNARRIAEGKMPEEMGFKGSEEIEELSKSLHAISRNAKELLEKVEKLSLKDKLTGLYNLSYIRERLDEEIQRAVQYQHPCSFAYLRVSGMTDYIKKFGEKAAEEALKLIAIIISQEIATFDRAARVTKKEFAVILPNRNKKKTIEIIERLLERVASLEFIGKPKQAGKLCLIAGLSENPIDGTVADVLYGRAEIRMKSAKGQGKVLEAFDVVGQVKSGRD